VKTWRLELWKYYELFGKETVFLPIKPKTKGPPLVGLINGKWQAGKAGKEWQKTTFAQTQTEAYQRLLANNSIGVLLGPASGRLADLDLDTFPAVDLFVAANPWVKDTIQSAGQRGRHYFFRLDGDGDYPAAQAVYTIKLAKTGEKVGEWRVGGSGLGAQTLIAGEHKNSTPQKRIDYKILEENQPLVIVPGQIKWPKEFVLTAKEAAPKPAKLTQAHAPSQEVLQRISPLIWTRSQAQSAARAGTIRRLKWPVVW